jgi:hypothetical protein
LISWGSSSDGLGTTRRWIAAAYLGLISSTFSTVVSQLSAAVAMADSQLRDESDPRLRIMAHAIRHAQQGEIALLHGVSGGNAVSLGFRNMFADNVNTRSAFGVNQAP